MNWRRLLATLAVLLTGCSTPHVAEHIPPRSSTAPLADTLETALLMLDREADRSKLVLVQRCGGEERPSTIHPGACETEFNYMRIQGSVAAFLDFMTAVRRMPSFRLRGVDMFSLGTSDRVEGRMRILCVYRQSHEQGIRRSLPVAIPTGGK